MSHLPITEDRLVTWMQRFVRHPSEQTDMMEADPAVLSFVTEAVRPLLEEAGIATRIDSFGNLIAEAGPAGTEMPLLLLGYAMTHPANRMRDPFAGEHDGGAVRGRGVSEQKSALAATLAAFISAATGGRLKRRVGFALLTAGETGRHDAVAVALDALGATPRFGILAIGTGGKIALGNRGRLDVDVTIHGKSSHSSTPWAGVDVTKGVRILLERAEAIGADLPSHDALGPATLTCTAIRTAPNATHTVQSEARMMFDRRLMPGEEPETVLAGLREAFTLDAPLAIEVERGPFMYGSIVDEAGPLVSSIQSALAQAGLAERDTFYSPGSLDAGYLIVNGIEAVKWGPGDPAQFHTDEERVAVADVVDAAHGYEATILRLAG
ncbi:M20/M25/M40 family metallo-hydrolase [Acuticoccus sp. M5D2P5]|uniref:M20 family metallopeptidase n=1 Tax=Acuticoccus kalidii TaxID=2910977 RepID=UPI001F362582|nr:M20/M25/M40 family metallo-hydrolase [Acuticoccus kalidii]MCF3934935.1 M20/M25/M40 family metallo-hydrolase [Acuticoccus kalidii]